ncbi:DUF4184 family protein [Zooshikella ganghwensis]|nr:DUF4184 family protein [Zooshikella ganghwensis]
MNKAMPYTLSHAIISLPVSVMTRGKIPLAALVVGSISPDFPYLLALTPTEAPGHSVLGIFTHCLIPSLLMLLTWYLWLAGPTLDLLRLPKESQSFGVMPFFMIVFGVLIGAYSHVLWDATSHADGAFVINSEFWNKAFFSLPLYKWNQYGSGILGLIALSSWYLYTVASNHQAKYQGKLTLGLSIYGTCTIFFIVLANVIHGSSTLTDYAVRSANGAITGCFVGMFIYALVVNLKKRTNTP